MKKYLKIHDLDLYGATQTSDHGIIGKTTNKSLNYE